uniref:Translation initiation factor IF-1, chloroplastic n=1 Tax=Chlorodesmis fastigiata TaxID=189431 RepID=A0A2P0QIW4_CHLFS|nr:translation initiation factor 1 [Chlorodesmis fastigiata]ARO74209.1 translation initiation factor 1 [Chlorodesmis fastigiata]
MNKKQNGLKLPGVVQKCLSNGMFLVELENRFSVLAHISGRVRINCIRILLGDHVLVEMSLYDLSRGRILSRLKTKNRNRNINTNRNRNINRNRNRNINRNRNRNINRNRNKNRKKKL